WADQVTLWSDCAAKSPHKARPHWNLAMALERQGRLEEAVQQYRAVVDATRTDKIAEALARASQARINLLVNEDELEESQLEESQLEEAVRFYTDILRLMPNSAEDHNALGRVLERQGKVAEAVRQYTEALRLEPHYARAHKNLERARRHLGAAAGPA